MSSLFGTIDRAKVKKAFLEYRVRLCAIVVSALAINFSVLYVVLQNLNLVLFISALYVVAALSAILLREVEESLNYKSPPPLEFYQPETLEHDRYTALWEEACINTGFCSGGVYVISRFSSDQQMTFGLARSPLFAKGKRMSALFMSEKMLGKFTEMQMKAIVLHECGHMRWMPLGVRYAVFIASLPISMMLAFVFFVRSKSTQLHLTRGLYLAERILHFMSHFHAQQSEEYAADAHAAEQMGTAKHIIDALTKAEGILTGDFEVKNIVRNAHLNTHPSTSDRILRLRALHKDDPH